EKSKVNVHISNDEAVTEIIIESNSKIFNVYVYDNNYNDYVEGVTLKMTVGSKIFEATSNANGIATFILNNIPAGTYTADIVVNDDNYQSSDSIQVTVKVKTEVDQDMINPRSSSHISINVGDLQKVSFRIVDLYSGGGINGVNVYFQLDDGDYIYDTSANGGTVTFDLSNLESGSYTLHWGIDDDNYYIMSKSDYYITVNKKESYLTVDRLNNLNITLGEKIVLNATLSDFETDGPISGATIVFIVNETEYTNTTDDMGKAYYVLDNLSVNDYVINYRFDGNKFYESSSLPTNDKLSVSKKEVNIGADDIDMTYGEDNTLTATVTYNGENVEVPVSININGDVKDNKSSTGGQITFDDLNTWNANTYTVNLTVNTNEYKGNKTVTVTIGKATPSFAVDDSLSLDFGDKLTINPSVITADENPAFDEYIINDTSILSINGNVITAENVGMANISVTLKESENYTSLTKFITVTVGKATPSFAVNDSLSLFVDGTFSITPSDIIPSDSTFEYATNDSTVVSVEDNVIKAQKEGVANITVTLKESDNYKSLTKNIIVTVSKIQTEITVENPIIIMDAEQSQTAGAFITPAEAGDLTYSSSNETVAVVENGMIIAKAKGSANITVSFAGNDKYAAATNKNISISVALADASVSASDVTVEVRGTATITPTTTPEGLDVTYESANTDIATVDENGVVTGIKGGNTTITIKTVVDGIHAVNSTVVNVTVNKLPIDIDVDDLSIDLNVGDEDVISANLSQSDAGSVSFVSSDESVVTVDSEGNVKAVAKGNANITVYYDGNEYYNAADNKTIEVTVSLNDASVSADDVEINVGDNYTIVPITTPDGLGLTYSGFDNEIISVEDGLVTGLKEGSTKITVTIVGDGKYYENSTVIDVTVSKVDTSISVAADEVSLNVGESQSVGASIDPADAGVLSYDVDDESVVKVIDGNLTAVGEGSAVVTVYFDGNDKYNKAENKTVKVTVSLNDASVSADNIDIYVLENVTIVPITTPEGLEVTYSVDDSSIATVNGTGFVVGKKEGSTIITVTIVGDGKYYENTTTINVVVKKIATDLVVEPTELDLLVGNNKTITAAVTPKGAGAAVFKSSNESVATVDANGIVTAVGEGNANIIVSFAGDDIYDASNDVVVNVTVGLNDASVVAEDIELNVGAKIAINPITVPDGLDISYVVANKDIISIDDNGNVVGLKAGNTTVMLTVGGDGKYALNNTTINVVVSKIATEIIVDNNLTLNVSDTEVVEAIINPNDAAGSLTYEIDNVEVATVDDNGKITAISNGTAIILIKFAENDKYLPSNATVTVIVNNKENPKKDVNANVTVDPIKEGENATIVVSLPEDATGNVTATVDGVNYTAPVVNGTATISIPDLAAGNYTVPVVYSGDEKYNPVTEDVALSVEEDTSDVISAPDVTKYYHGSERFVVNITDYKGNPIANKSVVMTINGVSYTRTTDETGQTSIPLNL
ncbi:MAG: Ig-like domain-containing protein, partial [Methanobrevibacter sp.]|nr:Ig-like domain-containing protein [Methanobrevibacter sp.]